jgi:hypothetical protein
MTGKNEAWIQLAMVRSSEGGAAGSTTCKWELRTIAKANHEE